MNEQWRSRITIEPGKRGGRPCIRGMHITVYDVLSYLAAGMTVAEILDDFPYLTPEDIQACFAFAAERSGPCGSQSHETAFRPKLVAEVGQPLGRFVSRLQPRAVGWTNGANDDQIWEHARLNGFAIVSKDADYNNLSVLRGSPQKVIWLQLGNCTTSQVEAAFRARFADIEAFEETLGGHVRVELIGRSPNQSRYGNWCRTRMKAPCIESKGASSRTSLVTRIKGAIFRAGGQNGAATVRERCKYNPTAPLRSRLRSPRQ